MSDHRGSRGPYRKGIERRKEIIAAAAQLFAESGYTHSSIRELAKRVNLTQPGVLHHFGDKEELLLEVLKYRDASVSDFLASLHSENLVERSREVARHAAENEGLTSLFIFLSAEAIYQDHPAHEYFVQHYREARETDHDLESSLPTPSVDGVDQEMILMLGAAVQDGLQIQRRYSEDLDVTEAIDAFWRIVSAASATWRGAGDTPTRGGDSASRGADTSPEQGTP
ncbi:TetR/AcrR family transcriptional regulator [Brachybacterium massiliense]|uniref:TetR/AcrR family transcriptional regulator n=1 Tax=Brachybacterium massiliense TaxID=1755098 RepID=UPI000B3BC652|nr:TetR/AcrR family transcriptional regulator [Brachybacterium massiliense]